MDNKESHIKPICLYLQYICNKFKRINMKKTKTIKKWSLWTALAMTISLTTACNDDDNIPEDDDIPGVVENQPTTDTVKTALSKKICALWSTENARIKEFLQKRMTNISTSLSEDAEIIIMGEAGADQLLKDETSSLLLKELWNQNRPVAFVHPAQNALAVYAMLRGDEASVIDPQTLERYSRYSIVVVKADGNSMTFERFPDTFTYRIEGYETDDKDRQTTIDETLTAEFTPNDFHWGQMAESTCEWLKENSSVESKAHPAFRSRVTAEEINYCIATHYKPLTILYDGYYNDPESRTVNAKVIFSYAAGYNMQNESDVYDVKIEETFPAHKSYIENMYTEEKAAYNYKYTGGFYEGPQVELCLSTENNTFSFTDPNNTTLLSPVPVREAGEISTTHYPGNWTLGGGIGLSGGYSGGKGGVNVSGEFSFSYTLPTTTLTTVASEMPVSYTSDENLPVWTYSLTCDYSNIYTNKWGLNADFYPNKIPDIAKEELTTSQMVTFVVKNTKTGLEDKKVTLNAKVDFKCHEVANSPFNEMHHTIHNSADFTQDMPTVYRFFEKYTPAPYAIGTNADDANWTNLETLLMNNVNYKAFKDETLTIGAVTEAKLDSTAQAVWEETIQSLIKQYNGRMGTSSEYTIGLTDSDGNYLPVGLQVKSDSTWTKVDIK